MKKIMIINLLALFAASAAFAATSSPTGAIAWTNKGMSLYGSKGTVTVGSDGVAASGTSLLGKCSTGVAPGWNTGSGGYAVNTQHEQGTKAYGTSYDSTAMWQKDVTKGTPEAQPSASDTSAFGTGWSTM